MHAPTATNYDLGLPRWTDLRQTTSHPMCSPVTNLGYGLLTQKPHPGKYILFQIFLSQITVVMEIDHRKAKSANRLWNSSQLA